MEHTPGPWRAGETGGAVVADHQISEVSGSEDVEYYGGHLVAESIAARNVPVIAAAPDLLKVAISAYHALKSYELGNGSPDLARECAAALEDAIAKAGYSWV